MPETVQQRLRESLFDALRAGHSIAAYVVTISANYRAVPHIPLSDYHASVVVHPLISKEWDQEQKRYITDPTPLRGFRVDYWEVPEQYLPYTADYDFHATTWERTEVETGEQLEVLLSRYVQGFASFHIGEGLPPNIEFA